MERTFYSHGKLLLSSEYVVLDGAKALAIPTKKGQTLKISHKGTAINTIHWSSFTVDGDCWYEDTLSMNQHEIVSDTDSKISKTLCEILMAAQRLNPLFLKVIIERTVETHLEFPQEWGLGSSSTLVNNIAQWADVDAFKLLYASFKGSGYDIAAAQMDSSFLFEVENEIPKITATPLSWAFTDQLFFVYLNNKQDSKEGISHYKSKRLKQDIDTAFFSAISEAMIASKTLEDLKLLMGKHEEAISEIIELPTVKTQRFTDYKGAIKSLGAWGGDFIMVTGNLDDIAYFKDKGYHTIVPFSEMCL